MKTLSQMPAEQASEWFALVRSGNVSDEADREWARWMAADPAHPEQYDQREMAWELTADTRNEPLVRDLLRDLDQRLLAGKKVASRAPLRASWLSWLPELSLRSWPVGIAAAAALVAVTVLTSWLANREQVTTTEYATLIGQQRVVKLADQSTLSLDTNTQVRVSYSRTARRVELVRGEAVFSVAKDAARPFEVHALHGVTTATGTQFDVWVTDATAAVSVLEGTVTVAAMEAAGGNAGTTVSAGQGVDYTESGSLSAPRPVNTLRIQAWQTQRIVFNDVALAVALREYNRYLTIPIVLGAPELADRHINGVFHIGDEDAFIGALEQGLPVKASKTDSQTLLQPR